MAKLAMFLFVSAMITVSTAWVTDSEMAHTVGGALFNGAILLITFSMVSVILRDASRTARRHRPYHGAPLRGS